MAGIQTKGTTQQDAEKVQEKRKRPEPTLEHIKALADESIPFPGLLGDPSIGLPIERHTAILGNARFSHSVNNSQKAGLVAELQQTYGNRYVQRLVQSMKVQAKLTINSPDDEYEREADRVANAVTEASASGVQRQEEEPKEEETEVQEKPAYYIQRQAEKEAEYDPASSESRKVIAHELVRNVQRNDQQRGVGIQLLPIQRASKVLEGIRGWFAKKLPKYFDKAMDRALETGEKATKSKALKRILRWARVFKIREIPKMIRDVRKASNPQEAIEEVLRRIAPGPWPLKGSRSPDEAMQELEEDVKETVPEPVRNRLLKLKDWLIEKLNIRKITEGLKGRVQTKAVDGPLRQMFQRAAEDEEEDKETIQTKDLVYQSDEISETLEARINSAKVNGQPLPDSIRAAFGPHFGRDFSEVRIHTDPEADKLSGELQARAFTTGHDVFFREGTYQPDSESGKRLIAHELTHVIQQGATANADVIFGWAEEEHKAFGDLAAQMAMKHDWSFIVGGQTLTPAGVGVESETPTDRKYHEGFLNRKVKPLKEGLKKEIGEKEFGESGIGVAHFKEVKEHVVTEYGGTYMTVGEKKSYMSFGDATMLGGDYFKTATDLKKAQTVNPEEMSRQMKYVAATNVNHFFPLAGIEWKAQYAKAEALAKEAGKMHQEGKKSEADALTEEALRYLGIAVHFLQDTFASGHQYPGALDRLGSATELGTALEGGPRKTYHDALCALDRGLPMQYGGWFHGDYKASGSDSPVVIESYRALAHILAIISNKPQSPAPPPRHNPGPNVSAITSDSEAGPIWTSMVSHLEEKKLPSARAAAEEGKAGYTTSAGTPYSAKEVMDEWSKLGEMKKEPTTPVEKLVDAALRGQSNLPYIATKKGMTGMGISTDIKADDAIRAIIKTEGVPALTHNQAVMVCGSLLTGVCSDEDERAFLQVLNAQTDAVFRSVVKELTPDFIDKAVDGKEWDIFVFLCAKRFPPGANLGAKLIASEKNDDAARMLVNGVEGQPPVTKTRLSPMEWIGIINALLSGVCGDEDEDAIVNILEYLVYQVGKANLVDSEIGKSKMDKGVDGEQWRKARKIMKDGGVNWE